MGGFADGGIILGLIATGISSAITSMIIKKGLEFKNHWDAVNGYKNTLNIIKVNYRDTVEYIENNIDLCKNIKFYLNIELSLYKSILDDINLNENSVNKWNIKDIKKDLKILMIRIIRMIQMISDDSNDSDDSEKEDYDKE